MAAFLTLHLLASIVAVADNRKRQQAVLTVNPAQRMLAGFFIS